MTAYMRAIAKTKPGPGLELIALPIPVPGPREVLIRVHAAGICGSDIPVYEWSDTWSRETVAPGQVLGHEFSGTVADIGPQVAGVGIGDTVTAEGHLFCGKCFHCLRGEAHLCPNQRLIGFNGPGAFADYICVPATNVARAEGIPHVLAAMLDPLGNAVHACAATKLTNANVFVLGCGPVGLMAIALARHFGARRVFASDPSTYRREMALRMDADAVYDPANVEVQECLEKIVLSRGGIDVVMEMSGDPRALVQGLKLLRPGGHGVLMGLAKAPVLCDFANDIVAKGITLHGIVGRSLFSTWQDSLDLIGDKSSGRLTSLRGIITHVLPFDDFEQAFMLAREGRSGKILLCPDGKTLLAARQECQHLAAQIAQPSL